MTVLEKEVERAREFRLLHDEMDRMYKKLNEQLNIEYESEKHFLFIKYVIELNSLNPRLGPMLNSHVYLGKDHIKYKEFSGILTKDEMNTICFFIEKYKIKEEKYLIEKEYFYSELLPKLVDEEEYETICSIYLFLPTTTRKYNFYTKNKEILSTVY